MSHRTLYRSGKNRIIAGVCGGIAEYFDVDPAIIRLIWILFTLAGGASVWAYIIAWIVVPESPDFKRQDVKMNAKAKVVKDKHQHQGAFDLKGKTPLFGFILMVIGVVFLANNFFPSFGFDKYWPIIPIGIGFSMVFTGYKKK